MLDQVLLEQCRCAIWQPYDQKTWYTWYNYREVRFLLGCVYQMLHKYVVQDVVQTWYMVCEINPTRG